MKILNLHSHTHYSNVRFLDCIVKPEDLIKRAIELGLGGIAVTDHECISSTIELLKIRDSIKETSPDFKIIFGNEIYLIDQSEVRNTRNFYHFILLAKDEIGWQQIRQLSSRAWDRGYMERGQMRVPTTYQDVEEIIMTNPGHVLASTACLGGRLDKLILAHDVAGANEFVKWAIKVFGSDNLAMEWQVSDSEEQVTCNKVLKQLADHYGLKYIITTDVHYLCKEDFPIHKAFLNSKLDSDRETEKFYKYTYLMSESEIQEILQSVGFSVEEIAKGLQNSIDFTKNIQDFDTRCSTIVPDAKIPQFSLSGLLYPYCIDGDYPVIKSYYERPDIQDRYLLYLIEKGLEEKRVEIDNVKLDRINTELSVVDKVSAGLNQKVSSYFLLMREVMDIAWNYSFIGCGRGSSSGFYLNYLLDLVEIDPLKYNLPYWRFLNDVRFELPDIDTDLNPAQKDNIMAALKNYYGNDNVLNCITFKTETLKAAIINAMRGLGYSSDDAQALSALVPVDRGHVYTLDECINGNPGLDLEPSPGVIDKMKLYPKLYETVCKIEGLRLNASIHASAVYIFNNGYIEHNSLMRAPNGTRITAYDMDDTNAMSGLKIDLLYTDAENKLMKCMDLLLKDHQIEWQGNLKATYNKYLHPDVLDYTNESMWEKASNGEIADLFQWVTAVGATAIHKAQPRSVIEMATINSAIRVQSDGELQPIDRYIMFHKDINKWYDEMRGQGLNDAEMQVMIKHLSASSGCSIQQEDFMQLTMDPEISGFTLAQANKLRKVIAHKILTDIEKQEKLFYECAERQKTRKEFATYVWDYCIAPLAKYSFSIIHATAYSIVAVQEMNLATRYNPLYWSCACLCVNAGNSDLSFDSSVDDEEEVTTEASTEITEEEHDDETETKKVKRAAPSYGKIAKAISDAQLAGVTVALPDINNSQVDFVPDAAHNAILYSLQAINIVSDDLLDRILANRPYTGPGDFYRRVAPTQGQMIGLIKAGCFDVLCGKPRTAIMDGFLKYLANQEIDLKDKLTTVQLKKAIELKMPSIYDYKDSTRVYKFKQYIDAHQLDKPNKRYILDDEACIKFFNTFIENKLDPIKDEYSYLPGDKIAVKASAFKREFDKMIEPLMTYMNTEKGRNEYRTTLQGDFIQGLVAKYCSGTMSKWEMDTMSYYYSGHELARMNNAMYNVQNFNELPEHSEKGDPICAVAGTITNADNNKHIVSLLTNFGVVDVKFYAASYSTYSQKISEMDSKTKKKTVLDDSWLKRGSKVIVYGQRRENMFAAKNYRMDGFNRMVGLIEDVHVDGTLSIRYTRNKRRIA